jgi:hypothetical protein
MRLYDAYKNGEITRTEYLAYLDFGYKPSDVVFLTQNLQKTAINTMLE